jgi:hypothetical protein
VLLANELVLAERLTCWSSSPRLAAAGAAVARYALEKAAQRWLRARMPRFRRPRKTWGMGTARAATCGPPVMDTKTCNARARHSSGELRLSTRR